MTPAPPRDDDPRSIRLARLREESDARSVGQLCYLVAAFSGLGTLEFLLFAAGVIPPDGQLLRLAGPDQLRVAFGVLAGFLLVNTAGQAALGYGLTHLQAWARWTVVALTGLSLISGLGLGLGVCFAYPAWGLLGLAIGTALHAMILLPLLTPGAGVVFSPAYRGVIRQTPEIRGRMHWLLKLFIGLILAAVACFAAYLLGIYLRIVD